MYDKDSISSHKTSSMPHGSTDVLTDGRASQFELPSLHRLRSAVVELSNALNETLRDERSSAAACLQRAKAILQGVDHTSLRPARSDTRRGLAPRQVHKVIAHIEANLGTSIRNK